MARFPGGVCLHHKLPRWILKIDWGYEFWTCFWGLRVVGLGVFDLGICDFGFK